MAPAPKGGCCEQGSEFAMYDFRQQAARDYLVNSVLPPLISGDGLDGTFLDSIDWFLTFGCGGRWVCTDAEREGLVAGSLLALDASLAYAAGEGKLLSVSSHNSLGVNRDFYLAQLDLIARHGNAWRFYEGFGVSPDAMETYLFEAQGLNCSAAAGGGGGGSGDACVPAAQNYSVPVMMRESSPHSEAAVRSHRPSAQPHDRERPPPPPPTRSQTRVTTVATTRRTGWSSRRSSSAPTRTRTSASRAAVSPPSTARAHTRPRAPRPAN